MAETALITGASSGIGERFARQLAHRGYELILVARRADRLKKLADELAVKAHVVTCDLGADADQLPGQVSSIGAEVDLLVNNAGFGLRGRFAELPAERQAELVRVNCEAVVILTRAFVPAMIERGRGGVITVASTAGMQPLPYEATYGASKAFALNLTEALHMELRGSGVKALAVNPGPVPTEWQEVAGYEDAGGEMMPGAIEAEQVVEEALRAYDADKRSIVPGRFFRNFMRANNATPRGIRVRVAERLYRPKRG
jgi:short-subunit dehydrogenase